MTEQRHRTLNTLLDQLEAELRTLSLWEGTPPPATAFESEVPFFADRMNFSQWLQWVFIARFRALLDARLPLPPECAVAPMAEESLRDLPADTGRVVMLISEFDRMVTGIVED